MGSGSLITTANFCHNGKFAVVGTYDGKCIFYSTEVRKYIPYVLYNTDESRDESERELSVYK